MKRPFFRVAAMVLSLVMLITSLCVSPMTASATETTAAASEAPVLAYVPLDDRPVVTDRVQYAATAAGWDIQFPPKKDWYSTRLDEQPDNAQDWETPFTTTNVGDGFNIMKWLEDMDDAGCDYYIIHLDMMFSGGLVGSRFPYNQDMVDYEQAVADRLIALSNKSDNHVYFIDTVMRLASTSMFKGYESSEYDAIRTYASIGRFELDETNFYTNDYDESLDQIQNIYNNYTQPAEGASSFIEEDGSYYFAYWSGNKPFSLTSEQLTKYHNFRYRKLKLLNYVMQNASKNVYYTIGVDDAHPTNTIQSNEIAFIKQRMEALGLGDRYSLFADTDSVALMVVARLTADYYNHQPKIRVRYYGSKKDWVADSFDISTLDENIKLHIACLNGAFVDATSTEAADIEVLVLTRPDTDNTTQNQPAYDYPNMTDDHKTTYNANVAALIAQANQNINNDVPTVVMDVSCNSKNAYNDTTMTDLQTELFENVEVSRLLGYSNWNTVGNTIGISLGQGISRYEYLAHAEETTASSHIAAIQSITFAYIKDISYNILVRDWFDKWLTTSGLGFSTCYNLYKNKELTEKSISGASTVAEWTINANEYYINNQLQWLVMSADGAGSAKIDTLENGSIYTSLNGAAQTLAIDNIEISRFRLPWFRSFEITFDIKVTWDDIYSTDANYLMYGIETETLATEVHFNAELQYSDDTFTRFTTATEERIAAVHDNPATITIKDASGAIVADTAYVGTGYDVVVSMADATTTTYEAVVQGDIVGKSTDTEGDGMINTADAREVLRYVVGAAELTEAQKEAANMDDSGSIGSNDARRILQQALGM